MKRKRDKKYFLTIGTCIGLLIIMIISLTNKGTYSYISCMGVISSDNNYCCDSQSNYSNNVVYGSELLAEENCNNYAITNSYEYYDCQVTKNINNQYIWKITMYNGCVK